MDPKETRRSLVPRRLGAYSIDLLITHLPLTFLAAWLTGLLPGLPPDAAAVTGLLFMLYSFLPHGTLAIVLLASLQALILGDPYRDPFLICGLVLPLILAPMKALVLSLAEWCLKGRTPGRRALGLTLGPVPFYVYFLRDLCREISFLWLFCIPMSPALFRRDGKTLYDLLFPVMPTENPPAAPKT